MKRRHVARAILLVAAIGITSCSTEEGGNASEDDGEASTETTRATDAPISTAPPPTAAPTTATTASTVDPSVALTTDCYGKVLDDALVQYVDDIQNQTPIPSGVPDKLYAVARACEALSTYLLDGGEFEASTAVELTYKLADRYALCLLDPVYQCGMLRMQYIAAVNEMAGCPLAAVIFDLAIGGECKAIMEAAIAS